MSKLANLKINLIGSGRRLLLKRHMRIILRYMTIKKAANILVNLFEFLTRKSSCRSNPIYLKVETSHFCHLKCPECMHSKNRNDQMKYDDFVKIVYPLRKTLIGISFSHFGEPMWCKDLPRMIKYANVNNIGTMFPTNFSVPMSDERAEQLV